MSRKLFGCIVGGVLALGVYVAAQEYPPANPQQPRPPAAAAAAQEQTAMVTVEGCLVREQDVPGRKPNVAERAGVLEDYILTNTKMVKGSAPQGSTAKAEPAPPRPGEPAERKPAETVGTSGAASQMFDVKGIDDTRLKELVGKRVQIEGTFADVTRSPAAATAEDLVDLRGTVIRQVSGECPQK